MSCAISTLAVFFATFTAASAHGDGVLPHLPAAAFAGVPEPPAIAAAAAAASFAGIGGESAAPSSRDDDAVGFLQLSAGILKNSSTPSGDEEGSDVGVSADQAALLKSRNKQPSPELEVLLAAVPRNEFDKIDAAAARYALHRLFVSTHGWRVEGLDPDGKFWNSSSLADVTALRRLPAADLAKLRQGWDDHGLTVEEVALVAATIEGLIHEEATERLSLVFELSSLPTDTEVSMHKAADAVELCMSSYITGTKVSRHSWSTVKRNHKNMLDIYPSWEETRDWVRGFVTDRAGVSTRAISFANTSDAMRAIGDAHGRFQDKECHDMKKELMNKEDGHTGRVRLADFYTDGLNGKWQFQESQDYLRMNGALDETNPGNLRVIIPNYVNGLSNCIGASDYHSICCISECESLRSKIDQSLGKPLATPEEIASVVASLASSTMPAKDSIDPVLMLRLRRIASDNEGLVPTFGRLFAQWMHHAYPRECEFPHLAGKTSPLDVYDIEKTGVEFMAPIREMKQFVDRAPIKRREAPVESVPWVHHEELFGGEQKLHMPPLFLAFHSALFVVAGLGMGWLARAASPAFFQARRRRISAESLRGVPAACDGVGLCACSAEGRLQRLARFIADSSSEGVLSRSA